MGLNDTKNVPGNALRTNQKSSIFDHFWYLFGVPGPPWGASGSQCDTKPVSYTSFRRFLTDIGAHWTSLWDTVAPKSGKKTVMGPLKVDSRGALENISKFISFPTSLQPSGLSSLSSDITIFTISPYPQKCPKSTPKMIQKRVFWTPLAP